MFDKLKPLFSTLKSRSKSVFNSFLKFLGKLINEKPFGKLFRFLRNPKFWRIFLISVIILTVIGLGSVTLWIASLDINKLKSPLDQPTFIYDRNGKKISQLSSSKIEPVAINNIPVKMQQAIVAVEDKRFYEHRGVDLWSILRALTVDLKSGNFSEGGSTITQQLAKNMFLPSDKTLKRKFKEAAYAIKIELTLDKSQIMEAYLNHIYFGEGRWGIQNASEYYFGKTVQKLSLEESALLAGLPKAPSVYSPIKDKDKALKRRNLVLALMKEQNYISSAEYQKAKSLPIVLRKGPDKGLSGQYAPYVDYVIEEAISRYGFTEDQILTEGLQIYTQMDQKVQKAAQDVYADDSFFPSGKPDQIVQSGIAIIDQHTGGIRGLVGYRGKKAFREFNHASQLKRQPGSAFKPLAVYGPALEKGYIPYSILYDGPLNINGYAPTDWDNKYRLYVTMKEAIENSWNIPAVWLLNEIGINNGVDFVKRTGIPLNQEDHTLSIALGGLSTGVSPLQMAQAYSVFANKGIMNKSYAISKITTTNGDVLIQANPEQIKVTDSATAFNMTLLLQSVVENGTGKKAYLNRPTAGKTGSVELPHTKEFNGIGKGVKDVWFVGYTPELTAAVWMGYDKTDHNHYLTISGGSGPAVVFREVLSRALSDSPVVKFDIPTRYALSPYWSRQDELDASPDLNANFFEQWFNPKDYEISPGKKKGKKNKD